LGPSPKIVAKAEALKSGRDALQNILAKQSNHSLSVPGEAWPQVELF
jgi:hypothetical protein